MARTKLLDFDFHHDFDDIEFDGNNQVGLPDVPGDDVEEILKVLEVDHHNNVDVAWEFGMGFYDHMAERRKMHGRGKDINILLQQKAECDEERNDDLENSGAVNPERQTLKAQCENHKVKRDKGEEKKDEFITKEPVANNKRSREDLGNDRKERGRGKDVNVAAKRLTSHTQVRPKGKDTKNLLQQVAECNEQQNKDRKNFGAADSKRQTLKPRCNENSKVRHGHVLKGEEKKESNAKGNASNKRTREDLRNETDEHGRVKTLKREIKGDERQPVPDPKKGRLSHRQNLLSWLNKKKSANKSRATYHLYSRPVDC